MNPHTSFAGMSSFENGDFQAHGTGNDNGNGNYRDNRRDNHRDDQSHYHSHNSFQNQNYGHSPNYRGPQGKWNPGNGHGNGNFNQSPNPNYKGKNFNPNYRGKNFNANHQGENYNPEHDRQWGGSHGDARDARSNNQGYQGRGYRGNQNYNGNFSNEHGNGNGNSNWNPNPNPNYKGKNFNPNYRGKDFNSNNQGPRGGSVKDVRSSPEPHLDGQGPFSGAQCNRRNRNRNRNNNHTLPPNFIKSLEEDILMSEAPPVESMDYYSTDVEMTDAPDLSNDSRIEVFNAGAEAVQQIVGIPIAAACPGSFFLRVGG
ncbi:hypothetical protein N7452_008882 [Penicillium brevicompactum]|uniref:Uncharacterized protein n=1 Tax=Penicillium brevicompactum TaxID=5074 RepID=A0A9W9QC12_PENBR|nr:hypothetical protein N7452_008882 [Penicillium brevicompactum]